MGDTSSEIPQDTSRRRTRCRRRAARRARSAGCRSARCPPATARASWRTCWRWTSNDRYLRFGYAAADDQIRRYVERIAFERDEIFGVFNRRLDLIALAHLAYEPSVDAEPERAERRRVRRVGGRARPRTRLRRAPVRPRGAARAQPRRRHHRDPRAVRERRDAQDRAQRRRHHRAHRRRRRGPPAPAARELRLASWPAWSSSSSASSTTSSSRARASVDTLLDDRRPQRRAAGR